LPQVVVIVNKAPDKALDAIRLARVVIIAEIRG